MKKNIILVLVIAIIFTGVGAFAYAYTADQIEYGNGSVKDAIDDLYTKKNLSTISFVDKVTKIGNTTTTYTFDQDIDLGFIVISASNDTADSSLFTAEIQSLTTGNYRQLDTETKSFSESGIPAGHKSTIYVIESVKENSVLTVATRYAGIIQIFKIN